MKIKIFCFIVLAAFTIQGCKKNKITASNSSNQPKNPDVTTCYANPVQNEAGGDPYCFRYNGKFYLYRPLYNKVMVSVSTDLHTWTNSDAAFTYSKDVWAPEVHVINGKLYLYFSVPNLGQTNNRDIMVCEMSSPLTNGSFKPITLVDDANINIDPTIYIEDGNAFLIWKWKNNDGTDTHLKIRKLSWTNPTIFDGRPIRLYKTTLGSQNTEHPTIEMQNYSKNGVSKKRYFLFYNTDGGNIVDYRIDYASSDSLMGPYNYKGILVKKNITDGIYGPGGQSIVRDGDNYPWFVYRTKVSPIEGWERQTSIDRLFLNPIADTVSCIPTMTSKSPYCTAPLF